MANKKIRKRQNAKPKRVPKSGASDEELYRQMIMDPCEGPLATPLLSGGSGQLVRLRIVLTKSTLQSGATVTNPYGYYVAANFTSCHYAHKMVNAATDQMDAAAGADISTGGSNLALSFLTSNTVAYRGVAGCVEFRNYTPSAEVAGKFAFHQNARDEMLRAPNNSTTSFDDLTKTLNFRRAPLDAKMPWRPVDSGSYFVNTTNLSNSTSQVNFANGIVGVFHPGGTADADLDFEFILTFVVEVKFVASSGLVPSYHQYGGKATVQAILSTIPESFWTGGKEVVKRVINRGIQYAGSQILSQFGPYQAMQALTL